VVLSLSRKENAMRTELIAKGKSWKSRICILIYATAMILMIKLIIGVVGFNDDIPLDEDTANKTEIREAR
jgi:hypothetical protein